MGFTFATQTINKKYLNTELKFYNNKIHRIFCNNNGKPKKLSKEYKAVCPFPIVVFQI